MHTLSVSTDSIRDTGSPVSTRDLGYVHPDIYTFYRNFMARHAEHHHAPAVRVLHVSPARISLCCDVCNAIGARSLDNRKGVK